jgi:hypothetical protein
MDELFLLPKTPVAMPRAYWLPPTHPGGPNQLTSSVLLLQPSFREFTRIETAVSNAGERDFDMEILNQLYNKTALVLPHRPYFLVTGEFRNNKTRGHGAYLGEGEEWDARKVRREVKYVHFSDWPMPKPVSTTGFIISPPSIQDFVCTLLHILYSDHSMVPILMQFLAFTPETY